MQIDSIDHLVLTVADIEKTVEFYSRVLGMKPIEFGNDRTALAFGQQKINLHKAGEEISPHARKPASGSADLCLLTDIEINAVAKWLGDCDVDIELGPVPRTGAQGPIDSIYLRDPDGNLLEISTYRTGS